MEGNKKLMVSAVPGAGCVWAGQVRCVPACLRGGGQKAESEDSAVCPPVSMPAGSRRRDPAAQPGRLCPPRASPGWRGFAREFKRLSLPIY